VICCEAGASEKDVAEMFDKYNLLMLPVVDEHDKLTGIITADDVIALLRDRIYPPQEKSGSSADR
jgi:Mg/Co/Ni transporter MgtE